MELRTFIKQALLDIVGGIVDAQNLTLPGTIVPESSLKEPWVSLGVTRVQTIAFEIQVRADESSGKEGKIGVAGAIIGGGVTGESARSSSHESKLCLKIPVQLPSSGRITQGQGGHTGLKAIEE